MTLVVITVGFSFVAAFLYGNTLVAGHMGAVGVDSPAWVHGIARLESAPDSVLEWLPVKSPSLDALIAWGAATVLVLLAATRGTHIVGSTTRWVLTRSTVFAAYGALVAAGVWAMATIAERHWPVLVYLCAFIAVYLLHLLISEMFGLMKAIQS